MIAMADAETIVDEVGRGHPHETVAEGTTGLLHISKVIKEAMVGVLMDRLREGPGTEIEWVVSVLV